MSRTPPTSAFSDLPPRRTGAFEHGRPESPNPLLPEPSRDRTTSTGVGDRVPDDNPSEGGIGFPGYQPPPPAHERLTRRSALVQMLTDTFSQRGARIGAVWVCILVVVAVFAPFIANSRPLVAKWADGGVTSPLMKALAPIDVTLLAVFGAALALMLIHRLVRRLGVGEVIAALVWVLSVALLASFWRVALDYTSNYFESGLHFFTWRTQRFVWMAGFLFIVIAAGILIPPWLIPRRIMLTGGIILAAFVALLIWKPISPPKLVEWDQWRDAERSGQLVSAVRTIVPFSPNDALADLRQSHARPQQPPNQQNWLGTTVYGEDMLSRMVHATRVALAIGFIATGIATLIGVFIGAVMGYFAGWTDLLLMRGIEIVEVIPRLIILIIITSFFGKNIWLMMVTIGLISWTSDARFIRAEFLKLRKQDFVQACVATGLPLRNILFRHMLPNGVAPVLVNASFGIAGAILLESVLSFLGLGLEQTESSWGALLNQAREGGSGFNWWIATFPGLAIFLTVFAYILIGEAMRDAIDPKLKKAGE